MSQTAVPPERPDRYQRSAGGLIVAMVVTVAAVVGFVVVRSLISEDLEVEPEHVDYLGRIGELQDAGIDVVYPSELPRSWRATGVEVDPVEPGESPAFGLTMLTGDQKFAGLRQESASLDDLLERYVVEHTEEGEQFRTSGSVADTWETFSDEGGDHAYAADVGDTTVLVYGSADRADLETLVGLLTTRRLPTATPSP